MHLETLLYDQRHILLQAMQHLGLDFQKFEHNTGTIQSIDNEVVHEIIMRKNTNCSPIRLGGLDLEFAPVVVVSSDVRAQGDGQAGLPLGDNAR